MNYSNQSIFLFGFLNSISGNIEIFFLLCVLKMNNF